VSEEPPNVEVGYYNEGKFTRPTPHCPHPENWHTRDIQATEVEVIEMIAGMVRGLQPDVVLETGTSRGFMAQAIGEALDKNGHGVLHSYEPHAATWNEAMKRVGLDRVRLHNEPSMVPWEHGPIDFAWFDSLTDLRQAEFEFYLPHFSDRAAIGFHDTAPHFGDWTIPLVGSLIDNGFIPFELPTPRGVILALKA